MIKVLGAWRLLAVAAAAFLMAFLVVPYASADGTNGGTLPDPNIISIQSKQSCGGSVLCSTNTGPLPIGTQGYVETGSTPFNLSTINSWFQIDCAGASCTGASLLPNQPAEQLGGAGAFLVTNDTAKTVTSITLTLATNFGPGTPSVTFCSGPSGPLCDVFQANTGLNTGAGLSGPNFFNCTSPFTTPPCTDSSNGVQAQFTSGEVTYIFTGLNIAPGGDFDMQFASWNTSAAPVATPEPSSLALLATGLFGLVGFARRRLSS